VEGALQVPGRVVALLEGAELDVAGPRIHPDQPGDLRQAHAIPGGDGRPALDAVVADTQVRARQTLEVRGRQVGGPRHQAADLERPARRRGRVDVADLVRGEEARRRLLGRRQLGGESGGIEEGALEPLVHPLHEAQEARVRAAAVAGQAAGQRQAAGGEGAAQEAAACPRVAHRASSWGSARSGPAAGGGAGASGRCPPRVMSTRVRGWSSTWTTWTRVNRASAASTSRCTARAAS
jgi:hypothetical protein